DGGGIHGPVPHAARVSRAAPDRCGLAARARPRDGLGAGEGRRLSPPWRPGGASPSHPGSDIPPDSLDPPLQPALVPRGPAASTRALAPVSRHRWRRGTALACATGHRRARDGRRRPAGDQNDHPNGALLFMLVYLLLLALLWVNAYLKLWTG